MLEQYNIIPILTVVISLYLVTWILAKTKKIKLLNHRRLWNIILTVSFFTSASLGLFLAIISDYSLRITFHRTIVWVHVEFGIILATVAVFHFLWHLPYYVQIIRRKKKPDEGLVK